MPYWECPRCGSNEAYEGTELQQKVTGSGGGDSIAFMGNDMGDSGIRPVFGKSNPINVSSETINVSVIKCKKCDTLLTEKNYHLTKEEQYRKKQEQDKKDRESEIKNLRKKINDNRSFVIRQFKGDWEENTYYYIIVGIPAFFITILITNYMYNNWFSETLQMPLSYLCSFPFIFIIIFFLLFLFTYYLESVYKWATTNSKTFEYSKHVIFKCDECDLKFHLPKLSRLKSIKCPSCKHKRKIPSESEFETTPFYCPNCSQKYDFPIAFFGKKFVCISCKHEEILPEFSDYIVFNTSCPDYNIAKTSAEWVSFSDDELKVVDIKTKSTL
ncbi:hypothetical protein OAF52_02030 [bacterium]|nr:hypothetical protein [bacterium]